jgi:hypothetical protein
MLLKRFNFPVVPLSLLVTITGCAMLSACAPAASSYGSSTPMAANVASATSAQTIAQLQQAKALDEDELQDTTLAVGRRGDLLEHEAAATEAIVDLQHGFPVAPERITYALEVLPRHLTPAQRAAFIAQLQNAIKEDEAREQGVVAFSSAVFYQDPNAPSEFGYQELLAQKQIKELEEGNHVSWDQVQQALYVPPDPL